MPALEPRPDINVHRTSGGNAKASSPTSSGGSNPPPLTTSRASSSSPPYPAPPWSSSGATSTTANGTYTLVQVAINDLIIVFAFAPIVMVPSGVSGVHIPAQVLIISVVVFIVVQLAAGWLSRVTFIKAEGLAWFKETFLPKFRPVAILALLATLTLIFAFQAENILTNWVAVLLLAVPILIQVYFNSGQSTDGVLKLALVS
jgi:hypothetical protein